MSLAYLFYSINVITTILVYTIRAIKGCHARMLELGIHFSVFFMYCTVVDD